MFRAQLGAADSPAGTPLANALLPDEPPLLLRPTYDLQSGPEEQGRRVAGFLADVARAVNTLLERQSVFAGRLVGVEASQRTLAEGADSAVTGLITQARA
eukprot:5211794-Alexandrium_andersonii.AAC.1